MPLRPISARDASIIRRVFRLRGISSPERTKALAGQTRKELNFGLVTTLAGAQVYRTILVVEDDPAEGEFICHALKDNPSCSEVVLVRDGASALEWAYRRGAYTDRNPVDVALILLDYRLPKLDGLDVARALKTDPNTKYIPIVLFAANAGEKEIVESYVLGLNGVVIKPPHFADFLKAVIALETFWCQFNVTLNRPI